VNAEGVHWEAKVADLELSVTSEEAEIHGREGNGRVRIPDTYQVCVQIP
jgi:hypothetical protein